MTCVYIYIYDYGYIHLLISLFFMIQFNALCTLLDDDYVDENMELFVL